MKVETDKRSRKVEPAPEAKRAARAAFRSIAAAETKAAKALATIERKRAYVLDGFRSVHAWAKDIGYGPQQTRRLLELGRTLLEEHDLEEKVAKGDVPAETAAQIGRMFRDQQLDLDPQQKADWKDKAQSEDPDKVRNDAEQATEDAHQGAPTFLMRFRVTKATRDGFRRVRKLLALGGKEALTGGEVLGRVLQDYLLRHDPAEKPLPRRPKRRRSNKRSRTVPERVKAMVRRRSGGDCEICGTRRARELIHLAPFAEGGSNEADNLADGCRDCHVLYDAGVFRLSHFDESGKPRFVMDHDRLAWFQARGRDRGDRDQAGRDDVDQDGASSVHERSPPAYGANDRARGGRGDGHAAGAEPPRERPPASHGSRSRRKRPAMTTGPP